jgi:hypothetical protein
MGYTEFSLTDVKKDDIKVAKRSGHGGLPI